MIKVIAVIHKRLDMSREEFVRYWRDVHAPLAKKMPGLRRYIINPGLEAHPREEPMAFDGIAELWFDDAAAARAAFASPAGETTLQNAANFLQAEKERRIIAEEIFIVP
jgi:uncharacterized protein (TIGR02118 family)